jgi:EmrB/QacA subfamily drug resistance transporter
MALHRPLFPEGEAGHDLAESAPCAKGVRPYLLAATILASAMAVIDGTIVTIALPAIQHDLQTSFATLQWVVNAYSLTLGSLLVAGGSAGDRYGRRRVFLAGTVLFTLASTGCALAPSTIVLIIARLIQGAGAALMIPQSLAIIAASFPRDVRGAAIGHWASASAITTALGPALGGLLIDHLGWRAAFWINVPFAVATIILTLRYVPESKDASAVRPLDWKGGLLAVLGFGCLTSGLTSASESARSVSLILTVAGLVSLGLLVSLERRTPNPLLPLSLFRRRAFVGANLITLLLYGSFYAVLFLLPFDLIEERGYSASQVGFALLPTGVVIAVFANFGARWGDASGPRWPLISGSVLVTLAALGLASHRSGLVLGILLPLLLMAAGMAIAVAPLTTAALNSAPDSQSGTASGVNNAASRLAGLFSVAIVGSIVSIAFFSYLKANGMQVSGEMPIRFGESPKVPSPLRPLIEHAFVHAYAIGMAAAATFGALAATIALYTIKPKPISSSRKARPLSEN